MVAAKASRPKAPTEPARRTKIRLADLTQYLFVLPAALFLFAFLVYPIIFNVRLSFEDVKASNLLSGQESLIGLKNYLDVIQPTHRISCCEYHHFHGRFSAFSDRH